MTGEEIRLQDSHHVCVLLSRKSEMMKSSILRRKSIELLKELIQILQEIIGSGDEESFRRLEETIRKLDDSRGDLVT